MVATKKLNLARFKKTLDGVASFASLIEQAEPANRTKILEQAEQQDAEFVMKVMKKVVFFDELIYLDESLLAEILSKTSPKVLAHALYGTAPEFREKFLLQVGHREKILIRDEEERFSGDLKKSLVLGAQKQILKIGRTLEAQNKFVFELTDCPRFNTGKKKLASGMR